jgi:hypothetical protein
MMTATTAGWTGEKDRWPDPRAASASGRNPRAETREKPSVVDLATVIANAWLMQRPREFGDDQRAIGRRGWTLGWLHWVFPESEEVEKRGISALGILTGMDGEKGSEMGDFWGEN